MTKNAKLLLAAGLAAFGLFAVAAPVFVGVGSELISTLLFFAPFAGLVAFVFALVLRYARGWVSGAAIIVVGGPVYVGLIFATILASMSAIA